MNSAAVAFAAADPEPQARMHSALGAHLVSTACDFFGVAEESFFSLRRGYYTNARRAVGVVLVDHVGWSERRTARFLGKHHSATQDSLIEARALIRTDPIFFEIVERLRQIVSPP